MRRMHPAEGFVNLSNMQNPHKRAESENPLLKTIYNISKKVS